MARRASQPFASAIERTLRLSQYVQRLINARPGAAADIERDAAHPFGREEMRSALAEGAVALEARLRRLRSRVMAALAHRDLNGLAPLDEVFATMTALAEECVRAALGEAHARAGGPSLTIAALGKLGGAELNVSSDIDLVFLHAGGEE